MAGQDPKEDSQQSARPEDKSEVLLASLDALNFGFAVFDRDLNLVSCNRAFGTLLGYPDNLLEPGTSLAELYRFDAERSDCAPTDVERQVRERLDLAERPEPRHFERVGQDDAVIEVHETPLPGTGGFVASYGDVTQRTGAEQALAASERRFRAVSESAHDAIVTSDDAGRIVLWNKSAEMLFGYGKDEILGQPLVTIMPEAYRERHLAGVKRHQACGEDKVIGQTVELEGLHKSGRVFPLELSIACWYAGGQPHYTGILRDITDRKRAEQASHDKTAFLQLNQAITRAANEAASAEDAIQTAVDLVCAHTGWPVGHAYLFDEALGDLAPTRIWHLRDDQEFEVFRRITEATRFASGLGLPGRVLASGRPAWIVDVTKDANFPRAQLASAIGVKAGLAFPVMVGRNVQAVLEFFSDTPADPDPQLLEVMAQIGTQLGRALERTRAQEHLVAAREEAMRATEAKSRFLANVSHELRTPMNAIIGFTRLLKRRTEGLLPAKQFENLEKIQISADHLLTLIDDLLDLSKIESGKLDLCLEDFDVAALVRDAAQAVQPLADGNGNSLVVRCADDLGVMHGDQTRVRQVILNLLSNACKFTSQGTVTLEAKCHPSRAGEWLEITVADTGVGIPSDQTEKVFEEFMRADGMETGQFKGTGLGLAISRRLCRLMGGDISLISEPEAGTTFTVRLPRIVSLPAEMTEQRAGMGRLAQG